MLFQGSSLLPTWQMQWLCSPTCTATAPLPAPALLCAPPHNHPRLLGAAAPSVSALSVSHRGPWLRGHRKVMGLPHPSPLSPDPSQLLFAHALGKHFPGKNICQVHVQHFGVNKLLLTAEEGLVSQGHQPSFWKVLTG